MNAKICVLTVIAACIGLLLTGFSAGQLELSVTLSSSGVVQQTSTGTYSFIISVSGSNYQMTDGTTGQVVFQSTNSSQVFSNVVANCGAGATVDVASGIYTVTTSWEVINANNITFNFSNGAKLVAGNGLDSFVLFLSGVNNCNILGVTIDGNAANQLVGSFPYFPSGIFIAGSNDMVDSANIYDCRVHGVEIGNYGAGDTAHSGVINSTIYDCGWNGYTVDTEPAPSIDCYLLNSEIYGCSDVGASVQGVDALVSGNYVHDMNGTTGGGNSHWGIGVEGGSNDVITQNTIQNCACGVFNNGFSNCTISENTILDTGYSSCFCGIMLTLSGCKYNLVEGNYVTGVPDGCGVMLVGSTFNDISGNFISHCNSAGISLDGTSNNNTVSLNHVLDSGAWWAAGIWIYGSSNYISQNQISDDRSSGNTEAYGIQLFAGATGNVLIGNNIQNSLIANIYDANVPENTYINNIGYNPVGNTTSPISGGTAYLVDSGSNST